MRNKDIETIQQYLIMLKTSEIQEEHDNLMIGLKEYMDDWYSDYKSRKDNKRFEFFIDRRKED